MTVNMPNDIYFALMGAGYNPEDVVELIWDKKEPSRLWARLNSNDTLVEVTVTTRSVQVNHRPPPTEEPTTRKFSKELETKQPNNS